MATPNDSRLTTPWLRWTGASLQPPDEIDHEFHDLWLEELKRVDKLVAERRRLKGVAA